MAAVVFSRPAREWTAEEIKLCDLWVCAPHNQKKIIASLRKRFQELFGRALPADIASEGYNQGYSIFFGKARFMKFDPDRYPAHKDKEKLFMVFFRTCVLRASIDYFEGQLDHRKIDVFQGENDEPPEPVIRDDRPLPDEVMEETERAERMRKYGGDLRALIERTLHGEDADKAVRLLREGHGAQHVARSLNIAPLRVAELRHATILKILHDDAAERENRPDDDFEPCYQSISTAVGVPLESVKVYVSRARKWTFAQIGRPFSE